MSEEFITRITRLEEREKQNRDDIKEIKDTVKEIHSSVVSVEANTTAVKFGWKVLATIGTLVTGSIATIWAVLRLLGGTPHG